MNLVIKKTNIMPLFLLVTYLLMTGLFFVIEFSYPERIFIPSFVTFFISFIIFLTLNIYVKDKFVSKIFIISILIHLIFTLLWQIIKYYLLGLPMPTENNFSPFISDNDGSQYHKLGVFLANNFNLDYLIEKYYGGLFPKFVAFIYSLFDYNPFLVCQINSLLSGFTACLYFLLSKNFLPRNNAKIFTILCIIATSHIVNTSVLTRDAFIVFFTYSSLYCCFYLYQKKNLLYSIFAIIALILLYMFRPYAAFVPIGAFILSFIAVNIKKPKTKNNRLKINKLTLVLLIFSPIIVVGLIYMLTTFATMMNMTSVDDMLALRESGYTGSNSDYPWTFMQLYNIFFLLPYIVGYFCLFFAPFPYEWFLVKRLHFIPDMIILYLLLPSFFKNIKQIFKEQNFGLIFCFFSIIIMFFIYSITVANSGTIHRLRGPFIPMIYLIAMYQPLPLLRKILNTIKKWRII